jgi:hypothetical protein
VDFCLGSIVNPTLILSCELGASYFSQLFSFGAMAENSRQIREQVIREMIFSFSKKSIDGNIFWDIYMCIP